jgi:F-type H+-transporting ATPase subunit b
MLIDWFTVGAQVLNFVILVWLLEHFLYKPILNAIDAREKSIAAELADADAKKAEARKESDDFRGKNKAFDEQRGALLAKAAEDAKAEGKRLVDGAQKRAESLRAEQENALLNDGRRLADEVTHVAAQEVFDIARKALADLATVSLEERMGEVFTRRLRGMDPKAKDSLATAIRSSPEPATVRSTFELPAGQRAAIQNALNEAFSAEVKLRFETAPGAICGIELTAGGQKLSWSIAGYLSSLEENVTALLKAQSAPAAKPSPEPPPRGSLPLIPPAHAEAG